MTPALKNGARKKQKCRWRRKRGPFRRGGGSHPCGYAMDADHITLTAGFTCGCPAATWVALRQPHDLLCEGAALHHYRTADVSHGKSSFFSLPPSQAVEA